MPMMPMTRPMTRPIGARMPVAPMMAAQRPGGMKRVGLHIALASGLMVVAKKATPKVRL